MKTAPERCCFCLRKRFEHFQLKILSTWNRIVKPEYRSNPMWALRPYGTVQMKELPEMESSSKVLMLSDVIGRISLRRDVSV